MSPLVIGYHTKGVFEKKDIDEDLDVLLADLAFDCADDSGSNSKFEFYKEQLLLSYKDHGIGSFENNQVYGSEVMGDNNFVEPLQNPILSVGPMDSAWPMQSHDNRHTGLSPYSTADVDGLEKWRFPTKGGTNGGIAIDDEGILYVGNGHSSELFAVYPNGTLKWSYDAGGGMTSTPAIGDDGTIYVGFWDHYLYAFNPDGSIKWRCLVGANIASSPAIADDGTIYIDTLGSDNGQRIWAINPDGTEKWQYQTGDFMESDPAIGDDGTIYVGSGDGYFYAMNPNGTLKWRFETGDEIHNGASIAEDGTIYFCSYDDYLYAINPDGSEKWRYDTEWGASGGIAIGEDGTVYVGTDDFYAIWPDGTTRWIFDVGTNNHFKDSCPAISADGTIYIGLPIDSGGGEVLAINPDGTEQWRKLIDNHGGIDSSPSIGSDGTVYIGSNCGGAPIRGYLHAFGPVESNSPPGTPTINGEVNGEAREFYVYHIKSVDPDNNPVSFYIDWGDGNEEWSSERASNEDASFGYSWLFIGEYTIRAKAFDVFGEESDWGTLEVSMPVNQQYTFPLLQRLFERFPNAFPILRQLLGL